MMTSVAVAHGWSLGRPRHTHGSVRAVVRCNRLASALADEGGLSALRGRRDHPEVLAAHSGVVAEHLKLVHQVFELVEHKDRTFANVAVQLAERIHPRTIEIGV